MNVNKYTAIRVNLADKTFYDIVIPNSQPGSLGDGQVATIKQALWSNNRILITFTDVRLAYRGEVAYLRAESDVAKLQEAYDGMSRAETYVLNMAQVVALTFNTFETAI